MESDNSIPSPADTQPEDETSIETLTLYDRCRIFVCDFLLKIRDKVLFSIFFL